MVPVTMACTIAEEYGIVTFFEPGLSAPPPTRPVLSTNTFISWLSSSSRSEGAGDDGLHDRGGIRDRDLLRARVVGAAADPARVEHEHLHLMAVQQFQHAVAHVGHVPREERVGAGDAQELDRKST